MTCSQFEKKIALFSEDLDQKTLSHLQGCESCKKLYQSTNDFFALIDKEKQEKVSPFMVTRIMGKIESEYDGSFVGKVKWGFQLAAVVFAFIFGIGGSMFYERSSGIVNEDPVLSEYFHTNSEAFNIEEAWFNIEAYEK